MLSQRNGASVGTRLGDGIGTGIVCIAADTYATRVGKLPSRVWTPDQI